MIAGKRVILVEYDYASEDINRLQAFEKSLTLAIRTTVTQKTRQTNNKTTVVKSSVTTSAIITS